MHQSPQLLLDRVDRFLAEYLPLGAVVETQPLRVSAWTVPGSERRVGEPVAFDKVAGAAHFVPVLEGHAWGAPWSTTWFLVEGEVPDAWAQAAGRVEASLDLGFNQAKPGFQCEGLVRTADGRAVKGLEPRNHHVPVDAPPGGSVTFYIEAAGNPDLSGGDDFKRPLAFAPTMLGDPATAGDEPRYRLGQLRLRLIDPQVEALLREVTVLRGLADALQEHDPRRARLLAGLERALYVLDPGAPGRRAADARAVLAPLLASPAVPSAHRIVATGHAHIDSAWLWPSRETVRKVTRTYANVIDLMDRDPDAVFVSSSAQHFAWVKANDPELFERVRARVEEGRFVPVGNMWVESDVDMPSGESLARQLLYGTRFFEDEFGSRSDVGWLPDSFGYPGSLPQLLKRSGIEWFFTQKMCWNDVDAMPHHTFLWEGIDGTRIFTHFPPNNTYSGDMRPVELARSVRNFADHAGAGSSLMPFGFGDGGGGPTREMMTDARLQADLEGSARVRFGTPREFFVAAEAEYEMPPVWTGEMYLEFHRGIFTSQARTKRGNRVNEALLVEAEMWAAQATLLRGEPYPHTEFDDLWREVLLLQFHDILPGSAIAWVHREAEASHERTAAALEALIRRSLAALVDGSGATWIANPAPVARGAAPALGFGPEPDPAPVEVVPANGGWLLKSAALSVRVDADGTLTSIVDAASCRELVAEGRRANLLQVHTDAPARWDAWELDRSYRLATSDLTDGDVRRDGDAIVVERPLENGSITQRIGLDPTGAAVEIRTEVDWHERHKLLKLAFPLDVHAADAAYETSFGHVRRPVHTNTSWDAARYETCAHRYVHVGEPGFGVAVVNDAVYGHDVTRESDRGRVVTTVRQSLLRAPTFPDPDADQGRHAFTTLIAPAPTVREAAAWGAWLASPPRIVPGVGPAPLVALDEGGSAVVSAIKLAADRSGDVVVRVFEQEGARTEAVLRFSLSVLEARDADLVETPQDEVPVVDGALRMTLRPFEIRTLRLRFAEGR